MFKSMKSNLNWPPICPNIDKIDILEANFRAVIVIRIVSILSHANVFCQSIRISYTLLHKTRIVIQDLARVVQNEQNASTILNKGLY